jgi:hypothetical protein
MNTKYSCKEVGRRLKKKTSVENKGSIKDIHYDSIGLEGVKRGLVDIEKWKRTDVSDEIELHVGRDLKEKWTDLPMECPDQDALDDMLERTLDDEAALPLEFLQQVRQKGRRQGILPH